MNNRIFFSLRTISNLDKTGICYWNDLDYPRVLEKNGKKANRVDNEIAFHNGIKFFWTCNRVCTKDRMIEMDPYYRFHSPNDWMDYRDILKDSEREVIQQYVKKARLRVKKSDSIIQYRKQGIQIDTDCFI